MPHVKINIPFTTSDGRQLAQGQTTYVSSADARNIVKDNRGSVVKLPTEEILEIARRERGDDQPTPTPPPASVAALAADPQSGEQPKPAALAARRAPVKKDEDA